MHYTTNTFHASWVRTQHLKQADTTARKRRQSIIYERIVNELPMSLPVGRAAVVEYVCVVR